MVARALEGPADARYFYVAPFYGQAKAIAWDILRGLTKDIAPKVSEVELWVDLPNKSRIRLFGADRPDALRGLRCNGLLADEYADWSDTVFEEILLPMLADTGGWGIFGGTPKGRNHFYDQREMALSDDRWHADLLPVSETGLIVADELSYLQTTMSPEVYAQEFECSFVAPRTGSYWGEHVERAFAEGRVGNFQHIEQRPVYMACDLGFTDSTACWYWQEDDETDGFRVIDYDEFDGRPLEWWMRLWGAKGYEYDTIWLPHDARAKSFQTGRSTIEQLLEHEVPCKITPNLAVQDGIEAVRLMFPRWRFNESTTQLGLKRAANYRRRYDVKRKAYAAAPLHDENSHGGDGARYMALVQKRTVSEPRDLKPAVRALDKRFQLDVLFEDRERRRPVGSAANRVDY